MTVSNASAKIFERPDFMSPQTDEMLYGEEAEIIEEQGPFCKVISEYGYKGWTAKTNLFGSFFKPEYVVKTDFADLLYEGRYLRSPYMTLPKGARVKAEFSDKDERFAFVTHPNEHTFYIRRDCIAPVKYPETETDIRNSVCETAVSYLNTPYRWGGRTREGIDCSGLCFNAYKFNGITLWRDADIDKNEKLRRLPVKDMKKGDLLFYKNHIALYLGDNKMIHANASQGVVVIENLKDDPQKDNFICGATAF